MLILNNVGKKYHDKVVLDNISLTINEPGLYILQGINGSGKSTLIKIMSKIIYKTNGKIDNTFSISYLPDKFNMPKLMSVKDYLRHLQIANINDLLSIYQIPNIRIGKLSKGNYQKLGLLQTLSIDVDCYILDEPIDGLDDYAKKIIKKMILDKINEGKVLILSLHNKTLFNDLNPTIFSIKEGHISEKKKKI